MLAHLLTENKIHLFVSFHGCHVGNSLKWMLSSHKTFNFFFSCLIEKQFPNLYISQEILKDGAIGKWVALCLQKPSEASLASKGVVRGAGGKQTWDSGDPRRDATREMSFNSWTNTSTFCCQKASTSLLLLLPAGSLLVLLPMRVSLIWKKINATITNE